MNQINLHPAAVAHILRAEAERIEKAALGKPMNDEWFAQQWAMIYLLDRADNLEGRNDAR